MIAEIGEALAAVCDDREVLARIGGVLGEAARAAGRTRASDDRRRRVEALAVVRAPVPPGLRGVDPSWIEAGLAPLPERARVALAEGPLSELDVWLVRRACGAIVPLPAVNPALARPRDPADVLRMSLPALRAWLGDVGADQLAYALGDHAAALGARLAPAVARIARAPRSGQLGLRRAAIERARGEWLEIGIRTLAPHLERAIARALVLRFPIAEGLALGSELTAHRASQSAAWAAIIAPAR